MGHVQYQKRLLSLKDHYKDQYFTVLQASAFLQIPYSNTTKLLRRLCDRGDLLLLQGEGKGRHYQYKCVTYKVHVTPPAIEPTKEVAEPFTSLIDENERLKNEVARLEEMTELQKTLAIPTGLPEQLNINNHYYMRVPEAFPNVLAVGTVKYIRADKIGEVILDQL